MSTLTQSAERVWQRIIHQESRGRQFDTKGRPLTSHKGAVGRAQVMPGTARRAARMLGIPFDEGRYKTDPAYNERLGRAYFDWLVNRYGNTTLAAAAYNAGEGAVDKWLRVIGDPRRGAISEMAFAARIPYRETRNYVANVAEPRALDRFSVEQFEALASGEVRPESGLWVPPETRQQKSLGRFLALSAGQDWSWGAIKRIAEQSGIRADDNYELPLFGSPEWRELTEGIPEQYWDTFGSALSKDHAIVLRDQLRDELKAEEELAGYGGWGVAGRIAMGALDPAAIALAFGTGGLGLLAKGERLVHTARALRMAERFVEARRALAGARAAASASPWANAARSGLIVAGENMAVEALLSSGSHTRDGWDVAAAGLTGFALGGIASRLFSGAEKARLKDAYLKERTTLRYAELDANVEARRAQILEQAGDPADLELARKVSAELRTVDEEAAGLREHLTMLDTAAAADRVREVESRIAGLVQRGAGSEPVEALAEQLARTERELRGRTKQRRALVQEMKALERRGHAVKPDAQVERLRAEVEARMRADDERVWGDQVDSPKVARKRDKEVAREVERLMRNLPVDPKVARLEKRMADAAGAIERLGGEAERLRAALRDAHDLRAAERELDSLRRVMAGPDAERARLEELEARRARLAEESSRLEKSVAAVRDLDMLDDIAARVRTLIALSQDQFDEPVADIRNVYGFGGERESLSAARYLGEFEGISDDLIEAGAEPGKAVGQTAFAKLQSTVGTLTGVLRGDPSDFVRSRVGAYVGDAVGTADGSVSVIGASEVGARLSKSMIARFNSAVEPLFDKWRKDVGKGRMAVLSRATRDEFMQLVGRAIKGEDVGDPHAAAAAAKVSKLFKEIKDEAQRAGVKGFEALDDNANYLPRLTRLEKLHELENRIGTGNVIDFYARAIREVLEADMPEADAVRISEKLARAYVRRLKELRVGADAQAMHGVPLDDFAYLRHVLEEAGEESREIDSILGKLAAYQQQRGKEGGKMRHARRRVRFDETFAARYRDERLFRKTGREEWVEVRMSDLHENNVETLFHRYTRSMSGHIGMAKAAGVKSVADHRRNLDAIRRHLERDRSAAEIERVIAHADLAYKLVVGMPVHEHNALVDVFRFTRDYNFATTMNQAGAAQIPDVAGIITKGYLRHTLKHSGLSDLIQMMKRGDDGLLADEFARETEEWLGLATDYHNNAIFASYSEDMEQGFVRGLAGKAHHAVRLAGRGTQVVSGMAFVNTVAQRLAAKAIIQRLVTESLKGGQISAKRAAQLGLDAAMFKRIEAQVRKHTHFVDNDVGGKVRAVNWAGWDDLEARDALLYAVFREARRLVQEEDIGETTKWMHHWLGKVIIQFRRFGLVSFTKQLLHGANHMDAETATRAMMSMGLAAVSYVAQMQVKLHALPERKQEEFRDRYLSSGAITAAAFARSTYASLMPAMIDTVSAFAFDYRFFDVRTSGLGSDLLTGNPTYALWTNLKQAVGSALPNALREDRQFDQEEARALRKLLPWQNAPGVDYLVNPFIEPLPRKDVDDDEESVDLAVF